MPPRPVIGALLLAACRPEAPPPPLRHHAYVWQRQWTPAVQAAVAAPPAGLDGLALLAAEHGPAGTVWTGLWDPALRAPLQARGPLRLVLRFADAEDALDPAVLGATVAALRDRAAGAGLPLAELQLDADVPTARLSDWAAALASLPATAAELTVLSLPDHACAPGWAAVDAAVDRIVLQVHSVPLAGRSGPTLLDTDQADAWLDRALGCTTRPLTVALPTHSLRDRHTGALVRADPAAVAAWLPTLAGRPGLAGVAWFRLPVLGDPHTWTGAALSAVLAGRAPTRGLSATLGPLPADWGAGATARGQALTVAATGEDHVPLPALELCADGPFAAAPASLAYQPAPTAPQGCQAHLPPPGLVAPGAPVVALLVAADRPVRVRPRPPDSAAP